MRDDHELGIPAAKQWSQLVFVALVQLLAMVLWFSASAVVPQLRVEWGLGGAAQSWVTMSVQLGFVCGALVSAATNLSDRMSPRALLAVSAIVGAVFNGAILLIGTSVPALIALRFMTGVCLAGVYPPGMKLVATWTRSGRGLGIGILVGAIATGSGLPHLFNALPVFGEGGMPPWRTVLTAASVSAAIASILAIALVRVGPLHIPAPRFDWRQAGKFVTDRPVRLANFGYLGHMWELYAMWTWVPLCLLASYEAAGLSAQSARLAGFGVVAVGAVGSVLAGAVADRIGRTVTTIASLALSGACALIAGFFFESPLALTVICLIWGFAVVADSAQFSAAVSELSDQAYVGTALTMQTSSGFLLTLVTIQLVPPLVELMGWRFVFIALVPGPVLGIMGMAALRRLPESTAMAAGNR